MRFSEVQVRLLLRLSRKLIPRPTVCACRGFDTFDSAVVRYALELSGDAYGAKKSDVDEVHRSQLLIESACPAR